MLEYAAIRSWLRLKRGDTIAHNDGEGSCVEVVHASVWEDLSLIGFQKCEVNDERMKVNVIKMA